jgi:hypothetical protein
LRYRLKHDVIKSKGASSVAQKMPELNWNARAVFDYPRMNTNACVAGFA